MNGRFISFSAVLVSLALLAGSAAAAPALPKVFTFATGYKLDAPRSHNVVELGVIKSCEGGMCLDIERYDTARMLPRVPTPYKHQMHAPYGGNACFDGPVSTVRGDTEQDKAYLHQTDDGFSVVTRRFLYRWVVDDKVPGGFRIAEISPAGGEPLAQAVGFGFASQAELTGNVIPAQLAFYYKGEIYHKIATAGPDSEWKAKPSSIDFRAYKEARDGNTLLQSRQGDRSIIEKYGKPMWVQSTIVLARGPVAIAPLVQEYGHDFNMDGCFDESGHNKLMLPVGSTDVSALVYIEYTTDYQRGFPMISVGRYYR